MLCGRRTFEWRLGLLCSRLTARGELTQWRTSTAYEIPRDGAPSATISAMVSIVGPDGSSLCDRDVDRLCGDNGYRAGEGHVWVDSHSRRRGIPSRRFRDSSSRHGVALRHIGRCLSSPLCKGWLASLDAGRGRRGGERSFQPASPFHELIVDRIVQPIEVQRFGLVDGGERFAVVVEGNIVRVPGELYR